MNIITTVVIVGGRFSSARSHVSDLVFDLSSFEREIVS